MKTIFVVAPTDDSQEELVRFGADVPKRLRNQAMAKIKLEGTSARDLMSQWLEDYLRGDWESRRKN